MKHMHINQIFTIDINKVFKYKTILFILIMTALETEEQIFENFIAIIPLNCYFDIGYGLIYKNKNVISLDNKYTLLRGIVIDIDEASKNLDLITVIGLKSNILNQFSVNDFEHILLENISEDPMWNISKNINNHNNYLFEKSMDIIHNTEH